MPARVSSPVFVGRTEELAVLESALARAAAGRSAAVLLGGDAGIGKSRLVSEFEQRARAAGAEMVVGECFELADGELPYGPIVVALRALVADQAEPGLESLHPLTRASLATLWPELAGPDRAPDVPELAQGRLFEAVHRLVATRAANSPLIVVIEDLHWADRSTRDLFTFLIRNSRTERVLFLASYRSDEVHRRHPLHSCISELERSGRAERVTLAPFREAELRAQLSGILGEEPRTALVRRLLERSEGNPFFVEELLAAANAGVMPETLRDAQLARVERLSPAARSALELAAAVGRPASHTLLASASEMSTMELRDALREAAEHRILLTTEDGVSYAFRHALLREAVYTDLLPGERAALHASLGEALSANRDLAEPGRLAAELAHHWYTAGRAGPALAASLDAAAQAERMHAYAEGSQHLERALELWDRAPASDERPREVSRADVTRRAAEAALLSGASRRAIALAGALVAEADPADDPTGAGLAYARLARYLWRAGRGEEAVQNYEAALDLVPAAPSTERAEVLAASAHALMLRGRLEESRVRCLEALEIARSVGARVVEASVLNTLAPHAADDLDASRARLHEARAIAAELQLVDELGRSYVNEAHLLEERGLLEESIAISEEGVARARELGMEQMWGGYLAADLADRLLLRGDWERAATQANDVLELTQNALSIAGAQTTLGRIAAERGDFEHARERVELSNELSAQAGSVMWAGPNYAILAVCELWSNHPPDALSLLTTALDEVGDSELLLYTAPLFALAIRAAADVARRERALGHERAVQAATSTAQSLFERLDRSHSQHCVIQAIHERSTAAAELTRVVGDDDPQPWLALADEWQDACQPYRAAYAQWRAADALVRSGNRSRQAEELLRSAAETATRLGAHPLLIEVSGLARRARLDLDPPDHARPNDFGLTEREQQVLALLAEGRTNRQIGEMLFMSEKTASVHVSRILAKLGVANRAQAAGVAHTLRLKAPASA